MHTFHRRRCQHALSVALLVSTQLMPGCSSTGERVAVARPISHESDTSEATRSTGSGTGSIEPPEIIPASAELQVESESTLLQDEPAEMPTAAAFEIVAQAELGRLESEAIASNPALQRIYQEAAAAWQRAEYVGRLPDPTVGLNVFAVPIETAAGSQRGNLNVMQMIPWLSRLNAREQQVSYEALSLQQDYRAARLRVVADVRTAYYKLYVLGQQIQINEANQELLRLLIEIATARVANGAATQGDVLLGTLELTRLQEELVEFRQLVTSTTAALNRLRNRPADTPIDIPQQIESRLPLWQHAELSEMARRQQPAVAAAQLTTQAARWGLEVARRERRPNFSVGSTWYFIGDNRPPSRVVAVGEDAWSIGATVSIPLSHGKYDAMEQEAVRKQFAAQFAVSDVIRAYDAEIQDLLAQARAAEETARLYQETILPQARQTLEADQQSYAQNAVEFDRVIADVRNLLTLELGYHRALGQLATAVARIQEAVGGDLPVSPLPEPPEVPPAGEEISVTDSADVVNAPGVADGNEAEIATDLIELLLHEIDVPEVRSRMTSPDEVPSRRHAGGAVRRGMWSSVSPGID